MIWLSLRQLRLQLIAGVGLLAVAVLLLGSTGPHIAHLYAEAARAAQLCRDGCQTTRVQLSTFDQQLKLLGTALVGLPALLGAFWGAPMITREVEHGTHRLVWTQSVTRTRWLAIKLGLGTLASVAVTGALSLAVTWWSAPMDRTEGNLFGYGLFGERNIVPLGYAAFGFLLGAALGFVVRRTLPAMALTLAGFLAVRLSFTYLIRPRLMAPAHRSFPLAQAVQGFGSENGQAPALFFGPPNLPNAWVYSTKVTGGSGQVLNSAAIRAACPELPQQLTSRDSGGQEQLQNAINSCVNRLGTSYHGAVTYQPANRYWLFQSLETGVFVLLALALAGFCFWAIRRRIA